MVDFAVCPGSDFWVVRGLARASKGPGPIKEKSRRFLAGCWESKARVEIALNAQRRVVEHDKVRNGEILGEGGKERRSTVGIPVSRDRPVGMYCTYCAARDRGRRRWNPSGRGEVGRVGAACRRPKARQRGGRGGLALNAGPCRGRAYNRRQSEDRDESASSVGGGGRSSSRRRLTDRSGCQTTRATPVWKRAKCGRPGRTDQNNAGRSAGQRDTIEGKNTNQVKIDRDRATSSCACAGEGEGEGER